MSTTFTRVRATLIACVITGLVSGASASTLSAQTATAITARDAWTREAPAGRKVTAVFLVMQNGGTAARSIVSGRADVGDTLELHEMKREGEMMRMSPVQSIAVPAGGQVELRPGGLHLMLFGLKKPLITGDTVHVTLTLDDGSRVNVAAPVRAMRQMP